MPSINSAALPLHPTRQAKRFLQTSVGAADKFAAPTLMFEKLRNLAKGKCRESNSWHFASAIVNLFVDG